jgi:hypothetical protein
MECGSQHLGRIIGQHSRPQFHLLLLGSRVIWTWRHLAAEVGTPKLGDGVSGLHNKLIGCGVSGAYAPGPVEKEEEDNHRYCLNQH